MVTDNALRMNGGAVELCECPSRGPAAIKQLVDSLRAVSNLTTASGREGDGGVYPGAIATVRSSMGAMGITNGSTVRGPSLGVRQTAFEP